VPAWRMQTIIKRLARMRNRARRESVVTSTACGH
jgi:hypothetical protein